MRIMMNESWSLFFGAQLQPAPQRRSGQNLQVTDFFCSGFPLATQACRPSHSSQGNYSPLAHAHAHAHLLRPNFRSSLPKVGSIPSHGQGPCNQVWKPARGSARKGRQARSCNRRRRLEYQPTTTSLSHTHTPTHHHRRPSGPTPIWELGGAHWWCSELDTRPWRGETHTAK